jgi:hypothetical protein
LSEFSSARFAVGVAERRTAIKVSSVGDNVTITEAVFGCVLWVPETVTGLFSERRDESVVI